MNGSPDVELVLREYLAGNDGAAPDYVLDVVETRIRRQPQRRAWRLQWRPDVNLYAKFAAAAAAILIVGIVGWRLLPGPGGTGGTATASPFQSTAPTAPPSPVPSASAVFPLWYTAPSDGSGILPAGDVATVRFVPGSTVTVPEGWVNDADNPLQYALFPNTPANQAEYALAGGTAQNILLTTSVANNMFAICDATGLFKGATAAQIIEGILANEAFSTTDPIDVTISGLRGQQVDIQLDPGWTGKCPLQESDPVTKDYGDVRNRVIVLDAPGRAPIGIAIGSTYSADFEAFLADAMPIVESIELNLGP